MGHLFVELFSLWLFEVKSHHEMLTKCEWREKNRFSTRKRKWMFLMELLLLVILRRFAEDQILKRFFCFPFFFWFPSTWFEFSSTTAVIYFAVVVAFFCSTSNISSLFSSNSFCFVLTIVRSSKTDFFVNKSFYMTTCSNLCSLLCFGLELYTSTRLLLWLMAAWCGVKRSFSSDNASDN